MCQGGEALTETNNNRSNYLRIVYRLSDDGIHVDHVHAFKDCLGKNGILLLTTINMYMHICIISFSSDRQITIELVSLCTLDKRP